VRGEQTALLVVDILNTYEHDDADRLAASVKDAVPQIADLIERARSDDVPLVTMDVGRIVLAGQATEQCSARAACEMMERNMHAQIRPAADVRLG
jgi:nicotinamidase-related amidase